MTSASRLSVWALPSEVEEPGYAEQIRRLADAAGSRPFAPHITLLSIDKRADATTAAVARAAESTNPFVVELTTLEDSDERFRSVALKVGAADPLLRLRQALAAKLGDNPGPYSPHLSLVYAEIDPAARARLRTLVDIPLPRSLTIDHIQLVDTGADDFTRWLVVQTWRLPSGPTRG